MRRADVAPAAPVGEHDDLQSRGVLAFKDEVAEKDFFMEISELFPGEL